MQNIAKTVILTGLMALSIAPAHAEKLTYGSWPPASDFLNEVTLPEAFENIKKDTNGDVTWDLLAGGQLAGPRDSLPAVADGGMDAGLGIPVYVPEASPSLTLLYSVVVSGNDMVATAGAAAETVFLNCPSCLEEAKSYGALPLGGFSSASYRLMCTSPVASLADMAGKRVRATGGYGEMANIGGATPMSVTLPDAVGLLQRGGLDCLMASTEWLRTFGYGDYAKFVTDLPLGTTGPAIGFFMNRDAFVGLSDEAKTVHLRQSAQITARHTIGNYVLKDQATFEDQVANNGVSLVAPGQDFVDMVAGFSAGDRTRLTENGKQLGVADPEALLDAYAANVEKWRKLSPQIGTDVDAFAQAIWDEVFSKVDPSAL